MMTIVMALASVAATSISRPMAKAADNLQVRNEIGEPMKPGWLISGQIKCQRKHWQGQSFDSYLGSSRERSHSRHCQQEAASGASPICR